MVFYKIDPPNSFSILVPTVYNFTPPEVDENEFKSLFNSKFVKIGLVGIELSIVKL